MGIQVPDIINLESGPEAREVGTVYKVGSKKPNPTHTHTHTQNPELRPQVGGGTFWAQHTRRVYAQGSRGEHSVSAKTDSVVPVGGTWDQRVKPRVRKWDVRQH